MAPWWLRDSNDELLYEPIDMDEDTDGSDAGSDESDDDEEPDTDETDTDADTDAADVSSDGDESTDDESGSSRSGRSRGSRRRSRRRSSRGKRAESGSPDARGASRATASRDDEVESDSKPDPKPDPKPDRKSESEPGSSRSKSSRRRRGGGRGAGSSTSSPAARPTPSPEPAPSLRGSEGSSSESLEALSRRMIYVPEAQAGADERKIAMFVDLENIALGVRDSKIQQFDIGLILERLLEKGKIIAKKAYADWERYSAFKRPCHEVAIELIDIPQRHYSGKNSADIKMVVDAMDLCYSKEHLDTFVLVSGDSDFSPLVSKLKENDKYVIGIGVKGSSSNLLIANCDEFIYYEDIWRDAQSGPSLDHLPKKLAEALQLLVEAIGALQRENKDVIWGSMVKQTIQRKKPSFSESYYGYSSFTELLEDAERRGVIRLSKDQRSGNSMVVGFAN